ncbi:MAG: hypothetical protein ABUT39_04620 [Acidobacteriota bacterium]
MRDHLVSIRQTKKITEVLGTDVVTLSQGGTAAVIEALASKYDPIFDHFLSTVRLS